MIRRLARMATYCVVLIPVLAFTGDVDGATAIAALWPRLLFIAAVLGLLLLAIHYLSGRQLPPDPEGPSAGMDRQTPNPASWGLIFAAVIVAATVGYLLFRDHPWMQDIGLGPLIFILVPLLLLEMAKSIDGERER